MLPGNTNLLRKEANKHAQIMRDKRFKDIIKIKDYMMLKKPKRVKRHIYEFACLFLHNAVPYIIRDYNKLAISRYMNIHITKYLDRLMD